MRHRKRELTHRDLTGVIAMRGPDDPANGTVGRPRRSIGAHPSMTILAQGTKTIDAAAAAGA